MYILNFHEIFSESAAILATQTNYKLITDFNIIDTKNYYIVFGAHIKSVELYNIQNTNKIKFIIMNSESEQSDHFRNKYYIKLLKNNYVFDYSQSNIKFLKTNFNIVCLGTFNFDFLYCEPDQRSRKYNIGFIGLKSDKREKILMDLSKNSKLNIYIDFEYKNTNPQKLKEILLDCEWIINIPFFNHKNFESHRINNALSCGCNVVSLKESMDEETLTKYDPYIYTTNDLIEFFNCPLTPSKKKYIDLITSNDWMDKLTHNKWIFNKLNRTGLEKPACDQRST